MKTLTIGIDTFTIFGNILHYELIDCYYYIGHQSSNTFCTNFRSLISAMDWYDEMEPQLLAFYEDNAREFPNEINNYPNVDLEKYATLIAHCTKNPQAIREIIGGQNACAKYTLVRRPDLPLSDDELFELYNGDYSKIMGEKVNKFILDRHYINKDFSISDNLLERIIDIQTPKYLTKDNVVERIAVRRNISNYVCEKISDTTNNYVIKNLLSRKTLTVKTLENIIRNTELIQNIARIFDFNNLPQYLVEFILINRLVLVDNPKNDAMDIEHLQDDDYGIKLDILHYHMSDNAEIGFFFNWFENHQLKQIKSN